MIIPSYLLQWFSQKSWQMHGYQQRMFKDFARYSAILLVAPTGGGKTLASFLPSLIDIHESNCSNLHTLYISPLKALTYDIQRNLLEPIATMQLKVRVESRTGDTSSYKRKRQQLKPPNILLTTPESLMLLLSYANAEDYFKSLKVIIIDELHQFVASKRGDLTALAIAQLKYYNPTTFQIGLSATVANPNKVGTWLGNNTHLLIVADQIMPVVHLLNNLYIPYSGSKGQFALASIYQKIQQKKTTLIFVNTRKHAELLFQQLWLINKKNLAIAIYHSALSMEQRLKTSQLMVEGQINAIVSTSALELGIDWGNVDQVLQIGAPKSISRLLQRIGRANHCFDKASEATLIPTNCFEALESQASIDAISKAKLDELPDKEGALEVIVQFVINSACAHTITPELLFPIVQSAFPYQNLDYATFLRLFEFAIHGGQSLAHYPQYHRLKASSYGYTASSTKVVSRHRQNIGTIIDKARLKVTLVSGKKKTLLGEIEESFAHELTPGDSFLLAGHILEFIKIHDLIVETKKSLRKQAKIPNYSGNVLPLSLELAACVLELINHSARWSCLPKQIQHWLTLQAKFSLLPNQKMVLVEQFAYQSGYYLVMYTFEGKRVNQTLGLLLTRRLEQIGQKPLSFTVTDYAVAIHGLKSITFERFQALFANHLLTEELETWLKDSPLVKRSFREIAIISGLIERQIAGNRKTMKQVTFSTDLIYEVLLRYESEHILLELTKREVMQTLLDQDRLNRLLTDFHEKLHFKNLSSPSPFAIPIISSFKTEKIVGEGTEDLLQLAEIEAEACALMHLVEEQPL